MIIRPYEARDFEAVFTLVETTLRELGFGENVDGARRDLENIATGYADVRAGFWIAEDDGILWGTIAIRPRDEVRCELKRLYVNGAMRGRGIGVGLYAHAEAFARDAGYARIWLDSSRKFTAARRLYERNGFVLLEEIENDWCDNVYEKRLVVGLRDLEDLLMEKRKLGEILFEADCYDRWGAARDTEEHRAAMEAKAARAEKDHARVVRELTSIAERIRREDPAEIARWANVHAAHLRTLVLDDSTAAYVRDEECKAWDAVARGERVFVEENVYYLKGAAIPRGKSTVFE
jgi:putative acetyltransferase